MMKGSSPMVGLSRRGHWQEDLRLCGSAGAKVSAPIPSKNRYTKDSGAFGRLNPRFVAFVPVGSVCFYMISP